MYGHHALAHKRMHAPTQNNTHACAFEQLDYLSHSHRVGAMCCLRDVIWYLALSVGSCDGTQHLSPL